MKNLLPFYLFGVLVVLSSCSPALYQPNTINVPTVDTTRNKEVKGSIGFSAADLHVNFMNKESGLIYQASFNMRRSTLNQIPGRSLTNASPRLGLGIGKKWINHEHKTSIALQIATSSLNQFEYVSATFSDVLWATNPLWNVTLSGRQWHTGLLLSGDFELGKLHYVPALFTDFTFTRNLRINNYWFDPVTENSRTNNYQFINKVYTILAFQNQFHFGKYLQLTFGMKIPISLGSDNFRDAKTFYTSELIYARLGIGLRH
ncbi:MAG: hypothetical protein ACPGLV_04000 [Bacteroidia bacterium]